jgi:geranylgeranyl diphosphate synthase type II
MKKREALEILLSYQEKIFPHIKKYLKNPEFPSSFLIPPKYKKQEKFHWELVSDYPLRKGKYLRPALLCLTGQAMGASFNELIKPACAMQISEDWLLIHDDLEDDSPKRRGKPALHKIYGVALAINAGDALHNIMWKVLFDSREILGEEKTFRLVEEFYTQLSRTTLGQTTEIKWSKDKKRDFSVSDWYFVADGKTSYYTIACPMRLGAIVAGAGQDELEKLAQFGIYLGRAFQLIDDILDVTSDFDGRKEFAGDIYEGKITVLLSYLLKKVKGSDKNRLISILNKNREDKSQEEVLWVVQKMKEYKAIDYARALALKWKEKAKDYFENELGFISKEPYRQDILVLIDFIFNRNY